MSPRAKSDYYPFGMLTPSRGWSVGTQYRFGFNRKEEDDEIEGNNNEVNYGIRIYNPRIGRFFSPDPFTGKYAFASPYSYAFNDVIRNIDLDGLETYNVVIIGDYNYGYELVLQLADISTPYVNLVITKYLSTNCTRPIDENSPLYNFLNSQVLSKYQYNQGKVYGPQGTSPYGGGSKVGDFEEQNQPYSGDRKSNPLFTIYVNGAPTQIYSEESSKEITPSKPKLFTTNEQDFILKAAFIRTLKMDAINKTVNFQFVPAKSSLQGTVSSDLLNLANTLVANPAAQLTVTFLTTNSSGTDQRESIRNGGNGSLNLDRFITIKNAFVANGVNPN